MGVRDAGESSAPSQHSRAPSNGGLIVTASSTAGGPSRNLITSLRLGTSCPRSTPFSLLCHRRWPDLRWAGFD